MYCIEYGKENKDVYLDMLTDSGTNAMSDRQLAAMMIADDSYAGSETYYRLEKQAKKFFNKKYFIPAHQGRACEHILAKSLVKPGDKAVYDFQVTNSGSIPAKLSENTVINKTLTCTGGASDAENTTTCGNIVYTLTYKDGTEIEPGDTLANGATKDLTLTVEFKSTATEVPSQAVTVNGISATLEYVQA